MSPDASWKRSYGAVWIAELVAITGFGTTMVAIPFHFKALGVTDAADLNFWNGLTASTTALALALMAPVWGALADAYGRKLMLMRAMFGGAVLIGAMSFVNEPWQLAALRTLQGAVTGTVAAATVLTASLVPQAEAGYRLGLLQTAVFLGNSFGPLLGGAVSAALGTRMNFLATAGILLVAGVLVATGVHDAYEPPARAKRLSFRELLPDLSLLARTPVLAGLLATVFAVQFATAVAQPILALIVDDYVAGPSAEGVAGLVIGAGSAAGAIAAALIGKVSGRFGYGRTLVLCAFGAFAFYLPQGFARDPWTLLALRIGSGVFLGGTMPSVNALIAGNCEKGRQGATYGLSTSVQNAGMAVGPVVGTAVANTFGRPAVFFVTSAVLLGVGAMVSRSLRRAFTGSGRAEERHGT
ncbi:MAG: MFS transporter [Spirochaetia bacterium]|nr:MFS transporter [Spirochaetia bacterium]